MANCVLAFSPTLQVTKATLSQIAPGAQINAERTPTGDISFRVEFLPRRIAAGKPSAALILMLGDNKVGTIVFAERPEREQAGGVEKAFSARFVLSAEMAKGSKLHLSYGHFDSEGFPTSGYDNYEVLLGTFFPPDNN